MFWASLCWWPRGTRVNSISRLQTIHSGEIRFKMRGERRRHRWEEPGVQDGAGHHPDIRDRYCKRTRRRLRAREPQLQRGERCQTGHGQQLSGLWITKIGSERRWVERMTAWRPSAGSNCSWVSTSGNATREEIASGRRLMRG